MRTAIRLVLASVALCAAVMPAPAQLRGPGSQPVEPFRVIGNIYYVGAAGISAHIIDTPDGLILLDTGSKEMQAGLRANIEKLGFALTDIKIILSSHAHWDHVEGHADMQQRTGARVMALGEDAAAISSGIDNSALGGDGWTPVKVDRLLEDGDTVSLGGVVMTAHWTPGHTKGCTTWTMPVLEDGKTYTVVFVGGTSINPGVQLLGNTRYPKIAEGYARTFTTLKSIDADVFLAQHPEMYDMAGKRQRQQAGATENPFIDRVGFQRFVAGQEKLYLDQLAEEQGRQ
ncbi:MAG: subclass B3 metallo-beta-lactamase [Rhodothermales bacterium]